MSNFFKKFPLISYCISLAKTTHFSEGMSKNLFLARTTTDLKSVVVHFGQALATTTFRQSSITFIGTALTGALGAVFYILAARFLGPSAFGLFNVSLTVLTLTSDIG